MTTLYAIAGSNKGIVVGTGNKVEDFGVGFFTKYGDGGVDISPIADLYKSEVYELADILDIIQEIQKAAPTDGLWDDDRTDEDQMGATYEELEWAMSELENSSEEKLNENQKKVLEIYRGLNTANSHKMNPIPVFRKNNTNQTEE
jgi:NAD+ synthase